MPRSGYWVGKAVEGRDWDPTEEISKIGQMVWNPATLQWERMVQPSLVPNVTVTDTLTALDDTVVLEMQGRFSATAIVSGTYSMSFRGEVSYDGGATYVATPIFASATNTFASTPGNYPFRNIQGATHVRLIVIAYTSGTANVTIVGTPHPSSYVTIIPVSASGTPILSATNPGEVVQNSTPWYMEIQSGFGTDSSTPLYVDGAKTVYINDAGAAANAFLGGWNGGPDTTALFGQENIMTAARTFDLNTNSGVDFLPDYVAGATLRSYASGASVETGTASHPLRTDPTGTTTQPVSGTFWQATQPTTQTPATSGGLTTYHLVSAATTNATVVKASAGQLYGYYIYNSNAAVRKLAFHNTASAPTAGASIFFTLPIPAGAGANVEFTSGIPFSTGIAFTTVTGLADSDNTAVGASDLVINLFYK